MPNRVVSGCLGLAIPLVLNGCGGTFWSGADGEPVLPSATRAAEIYQSVEANQNEQEPKALFEAEQSRDNKTQRPEPFVKKGSGELVGRPKASRGPGLTQTEGGEIALNMVDADIREVVRLVLEEGLAAPYVIDPAVDGKVTIKTSRPLPAEDVLPILNSLLNLNGAALIEQDELYKIVPLEQALDAGARPEVRSVIAEGDRGYGIQVAPLAYADAVELAEILLPFAPNETAVQVSPGRNTLLLVGSADQLRTLEGLIDIFDVDWMAGMSFGLYPIADASAVELAGELEQIFDNRADDEAGGLLRIRPIERLNAVLAIAPKPVMLERVESWIEQLDKAGDGEGEQVHVYAVQNGRAADLAEVLGAIFDIESAAVGESDALALGLEPIDIFSAEVPTGTEGLATGGQGVLESRRPRAPRSLPDGFGRRELTQGDTTSTTRVVADETNNSLLIRATAAEYRKIRSALRELDTQPLQVLLEATIAEVTLRDQLSYGVQWFFRSGDADLTLSEFRDGSVGQIFPGFSGLLSSSDVRVVVNALDSVTDLNVISSPQLLVLDNQTARLEVGDEVPIVTEQAQSLERIDTIIVNTVEQRQTGVILDVTPRVNANGLVVLDIQQEVSDVVQTTTSGIDSPTIAQRRIGTSVLVGTDQTVVLGGLIQDSYETVESGVPFLSKIPVLGWLFGATTEIKDRTELLVMITPKVIVNQQDARAVTEEMRSRMRSLAPLQRKLGTENERGDAPV